MKELEAIVSLEGAVRLEGSLHVPENALGMVLFAHGSGSSRFSPRNRHVARILEGSGLATLLIDLLTREEEEQERMTRHLRFDIELLAERLDGAARWLEREIATRHLRMGYFGASTGAAAALVAAARDPDRVGAVVSRGGRPDLARGELEHVRAPTLLIVGGDDADVLELNRDAFQLLACEKRLDVVPGATHLFEEPGALDAVADLATRWFVEHIGAPNKLGSTSPTERRPLGAPVGDPGRSLG